MMITIIAGVWIFLCGFFIGRSSKDAVTLRYDFYEMKISGLESKVLELESENKYLDSLYKSTTMEQRLFQEGYAAHCEFCSRNFYSRNNLKEGAKDEQGSRGDTV